MPSIKIACLGGGSLYFRRALADLPLEETLKGSEIVLYDLVFEKAKRMAEMGQRLAEQAGTGLTVRAASNLSDAVDGADFALSSIGGSGANISRKVSMSYHHTMDAHIMAKHGVQMVVGDTGGPGGMMMGFRSIPAHLEMCREMEERAPNAIFLNHSNPMAILMRAMHKYSSIRSFGICHGVQGGIGRISQMLGIPPDEFECKWVGTNHYYWFTEVLHKGQDMIPAIFEAMEEQEAPEGDEMCWELSKIYNYRLVYSKDDHAIEFYPWLAQVASQKELPPTMKKSAEGHGIADDVPRPKREEQTAEVRAAFYKEYQALLDEVELPEQADNSITGEGVAALIRDMAIGSRRLAILNMANQGAIPNLPVTAEVEVEAVTGSRGARPLVMGEAPPVFKAMLEKRFAWQELVVDAAVKGDHNAALQAMILDEMSVWPDKARSMLDELLEASRDLLPQFFR